MTVQSDDLSNTAGREQKAAESGTQFGIAYELLPATTDKNRVVLVHGLLQNREVWRATAQKLNKKFGCSVLLLDLPGHGQSLQCLDAPMNLTTNCIFEKFRLLLIQLQWADEKETSTAQKSIPEEETARKTRDEGVKPRKAEMKGNKKVKEDEEKDGPHLTLGAIGFGASIALQYALRYKGVNKLVLVAPAGCSELDVLTVPILTLRALSPMLRTLESFLPPAFLAPRRLLATCSLLREGSGYGVPSDAPARIQKSNITLTIRQGIFGLYHRPRLSWWASGRTQQGTDNVDGRLYPVDHVFMSAMPHWFDILEKAFWTSRKMKQSKKNTVVMLLQSVLIAAVIFYLSYFYAVI